MITPEAFAKLMRELAENPDLEVRHGDADDLMCEVLKSLGYEEGIKVYEEMAKL